MFKSIEELRIQRKLVQNHLDWLDEQIEHNKQLYSIDEPSAKKSHQETAKNPNFDERTSERNIGNSSHTADSPRNFSGLEKEVTLFSDTSNVKLVKFGCFGLFAVITLLFLFLLFVLPYLLN